MSAAKTIVLITGANSGIGFELAAQLLADASKHVLVGCRSTEKGQRALQDLQSRNQPGSAEFILVDVCDESSIAAAAATVQERHGRLDALVNNAAVAANMKNPLPQEMLKLYETNAIGPHLMGVHFAPLLRKSIGTPRIINVSSGAGSISRRLEESFDENDVLGIQYRASKAALNMVTAQQVVEWGKPYGFKIISYCPGFCVSNLTYSNKAEYTAKPTSEGAAPMVAYLNGEKDADHGKFVHEHGFYGW